MFNMFSMTRRLFTALMTCALLLTLSACHPLCTAHAATFTITRDDTAGGNEGGKQLVNAVFNANTQNTGTHTITFDPSVKNVTLPEEITIRTNLTINGNGATVTGPGSVRLFRVTAGRANFNRLTFTRGNTTGNGGAVEIDAAGASATFTNCTFYGNNAGAYGGAVSITEGSVIDSTQFIHCTITNNAAAAGGGISLTSGAASTFASVVISNGSGDIAGNVNTTDTITGADYDTADVLLLTESGIPELTEVNGVNVVKLSPQSPAIDYITARKEYNSDEDETGITRPQLFGYDLGAYEAPPIQAEKITIQGEHYIPVGLNDDFTVIITPDDASVNKNDYPPDGIRWSSTNESVITVSDSGHIRTNDVGYTYLRAAFHGWTSSGKENVTYSEPFYVRVGTEDRETPKISISHIGNESMDKQEYRTVKPSVTITANEYEYTPEAGVNYQLTANPLTSGLVNTTISGDSIIILALDLAGKCDVEVTASTIPAGGTASYTFTVEVSDRVYNPGRSKGGGGCEGAGLGLAGLALLMIIYGRRKD